MLLNAPDMNVELQDLSKLNFQKRKEVAISFLIVLPYQGLEAYRNKNIPLQ